MAVPWFDQRTGSSVPTWHRSGDLAQRCQIRRAAAGPEPRAAPAWGEHGEDPRFVTAARDRYAFGVVARQSVTAISKRRLNRGDGFQIEIDDLLKGCRSGAVAQAIG